MPTAEFLEQIVKRIDKIDREDLKAHVLELARQNQLINRLLDHASEGILVLNSKKEIIFANRRMIQWFNLSPDTERKGTLEEGIAEQPLARLISSCIDQKKELFQEECEVLLPRPMILRVNLFYLKNGAAPFAVVCISNVTQTETNLRERFKIENWESMLGLAAGIAHELGNPLNSLMIHVNLLEKSIEKLPLTQKRKVAESLKVLKDETARLDRIIRNFLKATRRKPLRFELNQINELLAKTVEFLKPELKAAKIRVIEELDRQIQPFLLDPERIHQVFVNIIKNAVHAMPKGVTLRIQTEVKDKLCLIRFQDTGVGIPAETMSKIFDAYYTTREEGTGLGLMIVHQIIREHGGRIEVASKPNAGTAFTVILPIRKEKLGLPAPTGTKRKP